MRILITGCAGFIGSHLVDAALAAGHEVIGWDNLSGGSRANLKHLTPDEYERMSLSRATDIADTESIKRLFAYYRFDAVIHAAAYAAEGLSPFIRHYNYQTNLIASVNLINAAINTGVSRFVFLSSAAVYGHAEAPFYEQQAVVPADPYGIAKYAVELDLLAAYKQFGLSYTIYRMHNVYGERQNIHDRYRNVVGIFVRAAMQGRPFPIFGDGEQQRAFTYISDIAGPIIRYLSCPKASEQVLNIGADVVWSVYDLAALVAEVCGVPLAVQYLPARGEVKHAYANHEHIQDVLGYRAETDLRNGLSRMATWACTQTLAPTQPFTAIEIERGLPAFWKETP